MQAHRAATLGTIYDHRLLTGFGAVQILRAEFTNMNEVKSAIQAKVVEIAKNLGKNVRKLRTDKNIPQTGLLDSAGLMELKWFETSYELEIAPEDPTIENSARSIRWRLTWNAPDRKIDGLRDRVAQGQTIRLHIFDDPDSQTLEDSRVVHAVLADLGFRTTKGVWVEGLFAKAVREARPATTRLTFDMRSSSRGRDLRSVFTMRLGVLPRERHSRCPGEIQAILRMFSFGDVEPLLKCRGDLLGRSAPGRRRAVAVPAGGTRSGNRLLLGPYRRKPYFLGDLCRGHIRYCGNFVFRDMNTLRACPEMPYHDSARRCVHYWYASSEEADAALFQQTISEANQDRLEEVRGACIM